MMVTKEMVTKAFQCLGIRKNDILLVHSSMKSMGYVVGGPEAVIAGLQEAVKEGTLVFPTLRSREFHNAYRDWDIEKTPSDVGLLSETFRKSVGVLRSDQETHSVAARGKDAVFLTEGHRTGKERIGIFGNLAFGHTSPWQRMYDKDAVVVMLGVTMVYNTFKHFVEYCLVEDVLENLSQEERVRAEGELSRFNPNPAEDPDAKPDGVWFWHDGLKTQEEMTKLGLVRYGKCGEAELVCFRIRDLFSFLYPQLRHNSQNWLAEDACRWLAAYDKKGAKQ